MESLDHWRLCDELTVLQAALLMVGVDPNSEEGVDCEGWKPHEQRAGYGAAKSALCHAILAGRLPATVRRSARVRSWDEEPRDGERHTKSVHVFPSDWIEEGSPDLRDSQPWEPIVTSGVIYRAEPDWGLTTVSVEALRGWLTNRGVRTGFFFPTAPDAPDYLDPRHARYAPKLAATVRAWLAVRDPQGKHPKQALMKWLRENAAEFGLSDDEGKPNEQGIEECAKVANWQPGGGAPKTPGM